MTGETVRWLGADLARLETSPMLVCPAIASFGDVIQLEPVDPARSPFGSTDGPQYRYRRVSARGAFRHFRWVLSKELLATPEAEELKARVDHEGGYWDQVMGGIFTVALPATSPFDPQPAIDLVVERQRARRPSDDEGQCGV